MLAAARRSTRTLGGKDVRAPRAWKLASGINTRGHIVGGWSGDPECGDCFVNAFLLTPRGFTNLAFPHALETVAWGINTSGQIVGNFLGEDETFHGFLRDP